MTDRKDIITANRVDLVLILLPIITTREAARTLATNGVPLEVATRVLAAPRRRRAIAPWRGDSAKTVDT